MRQAWTEVWIADFKGWIADFKVRPTARTETLSPPSYEPAHFWLPDLVCCCLITGQSVTQIEKTG